MGSTTTTTVQLIITINITINTITITTNNIKIFSPKIKKFNVSSTLNSHKVYNRQIQNKYEMVHLGNSNHQRYFNSSFYRIFKVISNIYSDFRLAILTNL